MLQDDKMAAMNRGNILISCDEATDSVTLRRYLSEEGFGVYLCNDFNEVLNINHYNLRAVIVDVSFSNVNAIHTVEIIKQGPNGHRLPILITCDIESSENIVNALNAGAEDYLLKPYSRREIISRISELIARSR